MKIPETALCSQHRIVEKTFLDFFKRHGYLFTPSASLITADETLLFTNDTITPWKHYMLNENTPLPGVCMTQPCVRLQGLRDTLTEENKDERKFERFLGYFNSLGIFAAPSEKEALQNLVVDLFTSEYGISHKEIKIFASQTMNFLDRLDGRITVERDTRLQKYYQWKYGLEGVCGSGATIGLLQKSGEFLEIGQIIEVRKQGKVAGYEFGFGRETFLARKHKSEKYDAWTITHCVPDELRFKTLLDVYSCFGAVCTIPEELFTRSHIAARTRLARAVAKLEDIFDVAPELTNIALNTFVDAEFQIPAESRISQELSKARNRQSLVDNNLYSTD